MAVSKFILKNYFNTGDKPTESQFSDLIDSFMHVSQSEFTNITSVESNIISSSNQIIAKNITSSGVISSSLSEGDGYGLLVHSASFNYISASTGDFDANTIFIGGTAFSKTDVDAAKEIEINRKSATGLPMKKVRGFTSASTFIDLESTNKTAGDRIDIKVANTFEALSVSTARTSLGPKETVPLELTGSLKVRPSHADPHEFKGKYEFKGNPDNFGTAGSGVVIQDAAFFNDKGGVVIQPGVISQSLNIGTATSPSINIMDGVEDSCFIKIADGITVRVHDGSLFKIQCPQPDITVDTDNDTITVSNGAGDETVISTGQFGTNPQYISNHTVVPSGQVAIWYGPIYIGRFTLNPFGSDFDPDGAGVLNMDLAGQGDNASLRIHNGSQIRVQAF